MQSLKFAPLLVGTCATIVACSATLRPIDDDDDEGFGFQKTTSGTGGSGTSTTGTKTASTNSSGGTTTSSTTSTTTTSGTTTTTTTTTTVTDPCPNMADFQACGQCYAAANPAGAASYVNFANTHIYCGSTCGTSGNVIGACDGYCQNVANNTPNAACLACVDGVAADQNNVDLQAFMTGCQADSACMTFGTQLQNCPP